MSIFSEINGKSNAACFQNIANYPVCDSWYKSRKDTIENETEHIIYTYQADEKIAIIDKCSEWLLKCLHLLMKCIVKSKTKSVSVDEPTKSLALHPYLVLAVQIDYVFGSRWLIIQLNRFGFCEGYDTVTRYKAVSFGE